MFRQKMADVTDCSCRLIPNQSNDYQLFKNPNSHAKPGIKEPKQKYSLKTQTTSSSKHQNKVTSAQKLCLKSVKPNQEQKISISANIDAKKQRIQKNLICSPENSHVRQLDQKIFFGTNSGSNQSHFGKMQNGIRTAQNNRRQQKRTLQNSHNQLNLHQKENIQLPGGNFISQKPPNYKDSYSRIVELPKKSLNFEEYYKYVSNPYSVSDKNKENIHMGDNPQVSKYKLDLQMKKEMRRMRNQTLPLQEIEIIPQTQIFHQSLEKYENVNQKQSRGTFNGSLTTKNTLNSQSGSMNSSKHYQTSLLNSKISNLHQNPSLLVQNVFNQRNPIKQNHSVVVLTQRDINISTHRVSRKDLKSQLMSEISVNENDYFVTPELSQTHRPFSTVQNSQVRQFMNPIQNLSDVPTIKQENGSIFQMFNKKQPPNQRVFIEKINNLNDIMNNSVQCESVLGEDEQSCNQNEQSIVIMRYQDLLEQTQNKEQINTSDFWLRPQHLLTDDKNIQKPVNNVMLDSTKVTTNFKPYSRQEFNSIGDSSISTNPNLKKTVKVTKEYLTHNFNYAE